MGLLASFMLAIDALWTAMHPNAQLGCDLNAKISCSKVAASWQSTLIHLGEKPVPNAFIGLAGYAVLVTVGVVIAFDAIPKWFKVCAFAGCLGAFAFATWLLTQSVFVIGALCPWCLTMFTGMYISLIGSGRALVLDYAKKETGLRRFIESPLSLLTAILIAVVIAFLLVLHYA